MITCLEKMFLVGALDAGEAMDELSQVIEGAQLSLFCTILRFSSLYTISKRCQSSEFS